MSSSELYNLKWNDFGATFSSAIGCLLEDADFVDVTLACDGQSFAAHKIVLSACSPYFKKLLKRNQCKHPIIILKDVNASILNWLIKFIYHGAVDVPQDLLDEFLRTAQSLEIRGLADNEGVKESIPPPAKRLRLSTTSTSETKRNVSYIPVEKARTLITSSSQSTTYIPAEKAKSFVTSLESNYVPAEKVRSSIRKDKNDSDITEKRTKEREISDSGAFEDSGSGLDNEREQTDVKQEYGEDDIQIVESDNYAKEEPSEEEAMLMASAIEEENTSMDAGPALMEGGLDDSGQYYGEYSGAEGGHSDELSQSLTSTQCPYCLRNFTRKNSLKNHIVEVHAHIPRDLWKPCPVCGKTFKTRRRLSHHVRYTHHYK